MASRAASRTASVSRDRSQKSSAARHCRSFRLLSASRRGSRKCKAASAAAALTGSLEQFGQGFANLKIVPQGELQPPRITRGEDLSEKRAEIRIGSGDPPVGMIEGVQSLGPKLNRACLGDAESAQQREIEYVVPGPGDRIATRITEREGRRRRKSVGVEEVVRGALIPRQRDALPGHDIGTVGCARVGEVQREVKRIEGRAVLQSHRAAG